jgi:hypothetical protein
MITVNFSIPEMDNIPSSSPELYLWLAYFWADIHSLNPPPTNPHPPMLSGIYTVPFPYARSLNQHDSPAGTGGISLEGFGNFQVQLDDGGFGLALAGVVIALLEKHDTPDVAIQQGQVAFGGALFDQINTFLANHGPVQPTDDQLHIIINGVKDAVFNAVKSHSPIWDWISHDSHVGTAYVFLQGNQVGVRVGIPNIAGDPAKYSQCSFPDGFVLAQDTSGSDPCADQAGSLKSQIAAAKALNDKLQALQLSLAVALTEVQRQRLRDEITAISQQLAAAEIAVAEAQRALQACRLSHLTIHP